MSTGVVWFRQDLRLTDNPALQRACEECSTVVCVFIDDPLEQTLSQLGEASRVWLHHSLKVFDKSLQSKGSSLVCIAGDSQAVLENLVAQANATHVYWNRCYDPVTIERDKNIKAALREHVKVETFNAILVFEPWENLKGDGSPYRVFTPFWKAAAKVLDSNVELLQYAAAPEQIPALKVKDLKKLSGVKTIDELGFVPDKPWTDQMMLHWEVGEASASSQLSLFLEKPVHDYSQGRNLPAQSGTSKLSAHLHFGEISPRYVLAKLFDGKTVTSLTDDQVTFAKEIVWREFAYCLIYHFPHTIDEPLDKRFARFEWAKDTKEHERRWRLGQTGVPIVDAGMRELYATGWMHNRVRMVVASYLIKNLLVPWQIGERWFRNTLVDADLASNAMGWQWSAGSGADAAPFFRVFNPVLQGEKFDKSGAYVRRWVTELSNVDKKFIHQPWALPESERKLLDYPEPLVDLKTSRVRALDTFKKIKGNQ